MAAVDIRALEAALAAGDLMAAIGEAGRVQAQLHVELVRRTLPPPTVSQPDPEYLDAAGAAALCRCSTRTLTRRRTDGTWREGEHWHRPPGSKPRYVRAALVAWLAAPATDARRAMGLAYGDDVPLPPRRRRTGLRLLRTKG